MPTKQSVSRATARTTTRTTFSKTNPVRKKGKTIRKSEKPKVLPSSKVADLKSKSDDFLECRELRHAYKRIGFFKWNDGAGSAVCRVSTCTRCGTTRNAFYRSNGKLMDSRYEYPEGYLLKGDGDISNADVVLESMHRYGIASDRDSLIGNLSG